MIDLHQARRMIAEIRQETVDRSALAALCLLLVLSVAIHLLPQDGATTEPATADKARPVDLGDGIVLNRSATGPRDVLIGACWTPIPVEYVEPSPHGADTSLAGSKNAADRVFYAYHGWVFGGRFAATELILRHLIWRSVSMLHLDGVGGRDTLAVKLTMPAGCQASPEEAMVALRHDVRMGR